MTGLYKMLGPSGFRSYRFPFDGEPVPSDEDAPTILVPGFVDLHIHGGHDVDFMTAKPGELLDWCYWLQEQGYEAFLPTTVTADAASVLRAIENLPDHAMIAGFHLEGPFISPRYPGAQPASFIASPPSTPSEWDPVLDDPRLRVITLAPELAGAPELIERLASRGVVVSMGHTNATYDEVRRAVGLGARHATHTFNAMRPLHHREAGTVGAALVDDRIRCELIYDRVHVCREAAALLVRQKPAEGLIAISDGTMAAGLRPGERVRMWGLDAVVGEGDVRLPDGTLAGSSITLLDAFRNLWNDFGPETAIRACCLNPRQAIGLGSPRVWVELDSELRIVRRHVV